MSRSAASIMGAVAVVVLALTGAGVAYERDEASLRSLHRDPSYRYGQLTLLSAYGTPAGRAGCVAAVATATPPIPAYQPARAARGCADEDRVLNH